MGIGLVCVRAGTAGAGAGRRRESVRRAAVAGLRKFRDSTGGDWQIGDARGVVLLPVSSHPGNAPTIEYGLDRTPNVGRTARADHAGTGFGFGVGSASDLFWF